MRVPIQNRAVDANDGDQLSRTQLRRQKRLHLFKCVKIGAIQRLQHRNEQLEMQLLALSPESSKVLASIATHRNDCAAVGVPHHFAGKSNGGS